MASETFRRMTQDEYAQGFVLGKCCAFIVRAKVLRQLPTDYFGELCPVCGAWSCSLEKLREAGLIGEVQGE